MNIFKSSILLFLITLLFSPIVATKVLGDDNQVFIATVNIKNARVLSQEKNDIKIAFDLNNKKGLQTGIKYGVQLIKDANGTMYDEKVFNESLTIYENSDLKKEITYQAPKNLSGDFILVMSARNESNFIFSSVQVGKIKLTSQIKELNISSESCSLQVEGENKNYTLNQNVDISGKENLKLNCSAVNEVDKDIEVTPYFETRYGSAFGKVATQNGGDYKSIIFKKGEKKSFSVSLPKGDIPSFYYLKFALMGKDHSSNNIYINYIIRGLNASMQKVSLDKDYYKAGEEGKMSLIWSASSGDFARSGVKFSYPPSVSLKAEINNENGRPCISPIEQPLVRDPKAPETVINFSSKTTCRNPKVIASIIGGGGKVLDSKEFVFKTSGEDKDSKPLGKMATVIIVAVLLIAVGVYLKKKNTSRVAM
jgi:hypothetical protein